MLFSFRYILTLFPHAAVGAFLIEIVVNSEKMRSFNTWILSRGLKEIAADNADLSMRLKAHVSVFISVRLLT